MLKLPFGQRSLLPGFQDAPQRQQRTQTNNLAPRELRLSESFREEIDQQISTIGLDCHRFDHGIQKQSKSIAGAAAKLTQITDEAHEIIAQLEVHIPDVEEREIQSKWAIQKTSTKTRGKGKNPPWRRTTRIYQCQCGINHTTGSRPAKEANRKIPWKFVGCPAWLEITTLHHISRPDIVAIEEISGTFPHSEKCDDEVEMIQNPRVALQPELREFALEALRKNSPLSLLKQECRDWAHNKWGDIPGDKNFRFWLTPDDASSLYRTIAKERGIPQRTVPEANLDSWFRKQKPAPPSPLMTTSCLHYQPQQDENRFELIISTPEQQNAAWKYGHKKQILMDLTFGFSSARTLLAILMAIDENGKGIPIAFMIFTARKEAQATHASYDTQILDRLLQKFRLGMGQNDEGEEFQIAVATTDNDARERAALTSNWPNVQLLLCIFHIWQSWRNGLNRYLKTIPKGEARNSVRKRLANFLGDLIRKMMTYPDALARYQTEIDYFTALKRNRTALPKKQGTAALRFLAYFKSYIQPEAIWKAWSLAGALEASEQLGIPLEKIARTTNHLESFNGRIKGTYFKPYQHSGRLPRIDLWVFLTVTNIMPDFF
ncbi:hypothetical protein BDN72DRAFT_779776, partial [Pluteus cervinus]